MYDSTAQRAVSIVPCGIMGTTGKVDEQRMAVLEMLICGEVTQNEPSKEMTTVYRKVAELLTELDTKQSDFRERKLLFERPKSYDIYGKLKLHHLLV